MEDNREIGDEGRGNQERKTKHSKRDSGGIGLWDSAAGGGRGAGCKSHRDLSVSHSAAAETEPPQQQQQNICYVWLRQLFHRSSSADLSGEPAVQKKFYTPPRASCLGGGRRRGAGAGCRNEEEVTNIRVLRREAAAPWKQELDPHVFFSPPLHKHNGARL